jgi:RNA polymerase sigma-32 factor
MIHDHLTASEERALACSYRRSHDRELEERLLRSQIGLVHQLAFSHAINSIEREDLVQEGLMGLLKAIRRFDPDRGVRLSTYAAWWIRAYQLSSIIKNHRLVRVGTTQVQRRLFFRLRRVRAELAAAGLEPTPERLGLLIDARPSDVREIAERLDSRELSLDAPAHADGTATVGARMAAPGASVDDLAMAHESDRIVGQERDRFRATLVGRRREVFDARWGGEETPTLQALGKRFGVSRERIRQIERSMLDELGHQLEARLGA